MSVAVERGATNRIDASALTRLRHNAETARENGWCINIDPPQPDEVLGVLDELRNALRERDALRDMKPGRASQRRQIMRLRHADNDKTAQALRSKASAAGARVRELEAAVADACQAVGALIDHCGLAGNPDAIRLQDVLAYGTAKDGVELLPFPKAPLPSPADALKAERDETHRLMVELLAVFRPVLAIARRNEVSPEIDRAAVLLAELAP